MNILLALNYSDLAHHAPLYADFKLKHNILIMQTPRFEPVFVAGQRRSA